MATELDSSPPPKRRPRAKKSTPKPATKGASKPSTKGAKKRIPIATAHEGHPWLWRIPLLAVGVLVLLAVVSFDAADTGAWSRGVATKNWIGPIGHWVASGLFRAFGISAYGAALMAVTAGILVCTPRGLRFAPLATFGWVLVGSTTSALAHLLADPTHWSYPPGGALGKALGDLAHGYFSTTGALIVLVAFFCMALLLATHFAAARAFELAARGVTHVSVTAAKSAYGAFERHRRARLMREGDDDDTIEAYEAQESDEASGDDEDAEDDAPDLLEADDNAEVREAAREEAKPAAKPKPAPKIHLPEVAPPSSAAGTLPSVDAAAPKPKKSRAKKPDAPAAEDVTETRETAADSAPPPIVVPPAPPVLQKDTAPVVLQKEATPPEPPKGPAIIEPRAPPKPLPPEKRPDFAMANGKTGFHLPHLEEILQHESTGERVIDRAALTSTASKLVQKLKDLGVEGEVTEIRPGPVVTMYEFKPAAGIKLSRISSLSDDLAMAMEALRVRIVAPIPGKGVVGFEVPNKTRETVFLKEVVEQAEFQKAASKLTMAVGSDIEGLPYVADLAKMPHLLIAGTTGSGKSVGVNAMLVSMLMRATPEELRFIMVDPKMLELSIYEGIPHLLLPVVTDPKKAALALRWGVDEMERRYEMMAKVGVRNLQGFNKWVEDELAKRAAMGEQAATDADAALADANEPDAELEPAQVPLFPEPKAELKKLPYIVIIIDELADLMMVAAKDVETYIARLAQKARASGIHLMVATQRPSTDVLTGVIKANFPTRLSFQVASRHDSGTIINSPGAENLLGAGDMLILPPGTSSLRRVHGAYVSETEINKLTGFWKAQGAPVFDPEILKPRAEDGEGEGFEDDLADELYDQALHAISDMKVISISLLQRKMRIGYNRSARMIERMEREGIVGPADGAKPREVLIRPVGQMPGA